MKSLNKRLLNLYEGLLRKHGCQGWWPIRGKYHPGNYSYPNSQEEAFEIMIGAILTQNTSWKNVEKSLEKLYENRIFYPENILKTPIEKISELIRSSGYYNQKAKKLRAFSEFWSLWRTKFSKKTLPRPSFTFQNALLINDMDFQFQSNSHKGPLSKTRAGCSIL